MGESGLGDSYTVGLATRPDRRRLRHGLGGPLAAGGGLRRTRPSHLPVCGDSVYVSADFTGDFVPPVTYSGVPRCPSARSCCTSGPGETGAKTSTCCAPNDGAPRATAPSDQHLVISTDATFDNAKVRNVEVHVHDNDQPAIVVDQTGAGGTTDNSTVVVEGNATTRMDDTYKLTLAIAPTAPVTVQIVASDARVRLTRHRRASRTIAPDGHDAGPLARGLRRDQLAARASRSPSPRVDDFARRGSAQHGPHAHGRRQTATPPPRRPSTSGCSTTRPPASSSRSPAAARSSRVATGTTDDYTLRLTKAPTAPVDVRIITDGQTDAVIGGRVAAEGDRHRAARPVHRRGHLQRGDAHDHAHRRRQLARRRLPRGPADPDRGRSVYKINTISGSAAEQARPAGPDRRRARPRASRARSRSPAWPRSSPSTPRTGGSSSRSR